MLKGVTASMSSHYVIVSSKEDCFTMLVNCLYSDLKRRLFVWFKVLSFYVPDSQSTAMVM